MAAEEGFRAFDDRRRRLDTFLAAYGWTGDVEDLIFDTLRQRLLVHIAGVESRAAEGDVLFQALIAGGTVDAIRDTLDELPEALLPRPS